MKTMTSKLLLLTASIVVATAANAHSPSEHMGKKEKPNCEALQANQASAKDKKDPIMQAVMKKCHMDMPAEEQPPAGEEAAESSHHDAEPQGHH